MGLRSMKEVVGRSIRHGEERIRDLEILEVRQIVALVTNYPVTNHLFRYCIIHRKSEQHCDVHQDAPKGYSHKLTVRIRYGNNIKTMRM